MMKSYFELTNEQQSSAIRYAEKVLRENINKKIIGSNEPLTEEEIYNLAEMAAEGSDYTDEGTPIEDVPYTFMGGCV